MRYSVGIDDHDSPIAGCTTHFSTILINYFIKNNIKLLDYPYLIRLNPNIPWKTRGNAAIKFSIEFNGTKKELADIIWEKSIDYVKNVSKGLEYNRKPGVAVIDYEKSDNLYNLYLKAVSDIIPRDLVIKYSEKIGAELRGYRGVIGSLAAIGFRGPITYELLTYRKRENWNRKREIDISSVKAFDELFFPKVFANMDYIKKKPLIISHGNDPVFYGIRGLDPNILIKGLETIKTNEKLDMAMIFKSNQATDAHIIKTGNRVYQTIKDSCIVDDIKVIRGGDVIIKCLNSATLICYKETGELNLATKNLMHGDIIEFVGSIKPSLEFGEIIEIERIHINSLVNSKFANPRCPKCNGSTESLGKNKGFRCKKCGNKFLGNKIIIQIPRNLSLGIYQARYYRHLTKPLFLEDLDNSFKYEYIMDFYIIYNSINNILYSN